MNMDCNNLFLCVYLGIFKEKKVFSQVVLTRQTIGLTCCLALITFITISAAIASVLVTIIRFEARVADSCGDSCLGNSHASLTWLMSMEDNR